MKTFTFSSNPAEPLTIFSGQLFYDVYKDAEFLRHSENIETILSKGHELRDALKQVKPGDFVTLTMPLERNTPLIVKKTGPNVKVENFEFTANRLTGLVAAYAFENRHRFPVLKCSEAHALGLTWDNENEAKCRLFLSSVSGSDHFYDQFQYWPLVCALRKLELKKITLEPVVKIAKVKNPLGERMANEMIRNLPTVRILWEQFPGASVERLKSFLQNVPPELKKVVLTNSCFDQNQLGRNDIKLFVV